jgi:hypothetical protein
MSNVFRGTDLENGARIYSSVPKPSKSYLRKLKRKQYKELKPAIEPKAIKVKVQKRSDGKRSDAGKKRPHSHTTRKLSEQQIAHLISDYRGNGMPLADLGDKYNISLACASRYLSRYMFEKKSRLIL